MLQNKIPNCVVVASVKQHSEDVLNRVFSDGADRAVELREAYLLFDCLHCQNTSKTPHASTVFRMVVCHLFDSTSNRGSLVLQYTI